MRFEVFNIVKIQVKIFWVVMPHGVMVGDQHYRGPTSEKRLHGRTRCGWETLEWILEK